MPLYPISKCTRGLWSMGAQVFNFRYLNSHCFPFLSPPVRRHGGLLWVTFCLSVCHMTKKQNGPKVVLDQKSVDKNTQGSICLSLCSQRHPWGVSVCLSVFVILGNLGVGSMSMSSCIFFLSVYPYISVMIYYR